MVHTLFDFMDENSVLFRILQGAEGCVDKPFLWTEGRVSLRAALDKSAYIHGEHIIVTVDVKNDSRKIIRKIRVRHLSKPKMIYLNRWRWHFK